MLQTKDMITLKNWLVYRITKGKCLENTEYKNSRRIGNWNPSQTVCDIFGAVKVLTMCNLTINILLNCKRTWLYFPCYIVALISDFIELRDGFPFVWLPRYHWGNHTIY